MAPPPPAPARDTLVPVHLRSVPVSLAARAVSHREELLRGFAFIVADALNEDAEPAAHEVPAKVLDAFVTLAHEFGDLNDDAEARLAEAIANGADTIDDLVLQLPQDASSMLKSIAVMLDEADLYCWQADQLLDLATPVDCLAFRRWWFSTVLDQLDGRHPIGWPDSVAARAM